VISGLPGCRKRATSESGSHADAARCAGRAVTKVTDAVSLRSQTAPVLRREDCINADRPSAPQQQRGIGMRKALILLSVAIAALSLPAEAGATPAPVHVAFGQGVWHSSCGFAVLCSREESVRINASDAEGQYGSVTYQCLAVSEFYPCYDGNTSALLDITLNCVGVREFLGQGHELFASGTDQSGADVYIFLRVPELGTPEVGISFEPYWFDTPCRAIPGGAEVQVGLFTIQPDVPSPYRADLSVTDTASPDPVPDGQPLAYDLTVRNGGPDPATNVVLGNGWPPNVDLVSATSSRGPCSQAGRSAQCEIGTLASGEVASARIVVRPKRSGTLYNLTEAWTDDVPDPNYDNNSVLESSVVDPATDLVLTQSDSADPVSIGERLSYTLQVDNAGPETAKGVSLVDTLGKGLRFWSARSDQGRCVQRTRTTVECNLADLATNGTATITLVVRPTRPGSPSNTASVRASQPDDPNPADNTVTETTTVQR
jgi:uncharacterized repeat protein (TIGR01451 family)